MVSTVDMKSHTMTVRRGGQVIRTIPVSTGKPGPLTETRYGTKVIIRKEGKVTMDSSTVGIPKGDPDYYKIDTKWNLRVTWTGEYLHSAPWSVRAQGNSNVSHGCVNMSPANAQWMYENSKVGDVVRFTGSNRGLPAPRGDRCLDVRLRRLEGPERPALAGQQPVPARPSQPSQPGPDARRGRGALAPAEVVQALVVDAEVVRDLVHHGDRDLVEEVLAVLAHAGERTPGRW